MDDKCLVGVGVYSQIFDESLIKKNKNENENDMIKKGMKIGVIGRYSKKVIKKLVCPVTMQLTSTQTGK